MPVPPRVIDLTKAVGTDAPPRRMPQSGCKFTIGHVLVGSLKRVINQLWVDGMFLQAAPDRQCRPAGAALAARPRQRKGRVIDVTQPHAVRDDIFKGALNLCPVVIFKLPNRESLQHFAQTLP